MKFQYKKFGSGMIRPIIPIAISYRDKSVDQEVLVDSGADICLFDARIGRAIGIPVEQGETRTYRGATGDPQTFYLHPIALMVGGWTHKIQAGFVPDFIPRYGIAGQVGFFDLYTIRFSYQKGEIELKPVEGRK